jgi:signal transduction histidine kinase
LWAAVTSLADSAPVVVIGAAEHQAELTELLASGVADYVNRSEYSMSVAVGLIERRLRQWFLHSGNQTRARKENHSTQACNLGTAETRDFVQVLRHELNNPLTGILGNAELLLHRQNIELPSSLEGRLETIASLPVRMRETVRNLSQEWEVKEEKRDCEFAEQPA